MSIPKPIETDYKEYRFRSRLEARWAVFFDSYGIQHDNELDSFELSNGQWYLPEFYLPELNVYVDVKPNKNFQLGDLKKIEEFALIDGNNLLLIIGKPASEYMVLFNNKKCSVSLLDEYIAENEFGLSEEEIVAEYIDNAIEISLVEFNRDPLNNNLLLTYKKRCPNDEIIFKTSLLKAKMERFL